MDLPGPDLSVLGTPDAPTFGVDTFGDVGNGPDGTPVSHAQAIREVVAEGVLADQLGLDYLGIGEHHRVDFAVTSPETVLAAIAARTSRIRLGTGVTVLSSDDPVRLYERFATLDAISDGRAEIQLGRGSFTESFPLFGHDLADYDLLYADKLDLWTHLMTEGPVTWEGHTRAALQEQRVYPTTAAGIPSWVAVGGSPESVVRAASYGLPLVMAVIGGSPASFKPLAEYYRKALAHFGKPDLPIAMHSPGHIAASDAEAADQHFEHQSPMFSRIGRERGWPPLTRERYDRDLGAQGALFVGSPDTVAVKMAWAIRLLGLSRFQLKYSVGTMPHELRAQSLRLYAEEVVPRVRRLLAQ